MDQQGLTPAFWELAIQFGLTFPSGPHFCLPLPPLNIQTCNHIAPACKSSLVGTIKQLRGDDKGQSLRV